MNIQRSVNGAHTHAQGDWERQHLRFFIVIGVIPYCMILYSTFVCVAWPCVWQSFKRTNVKGFTGFEPHALANAHTHARAQQLLKYVRCLFMHLCARKEYRYCLFLYLRNVRGFYPVQYAPQLSKHLAAPRGPYTSACRF